MLSTTFSNGLLEGHKLYDAAPIKHIVRRKLAVHESEIAVFHFRKKH